MNEISTARINLDIYLPTYLISPHLTSNHSHIKPLFQKALSFSIQNVGRNDIDDYTRVYYLGLVLNNTLIYAWVRLPV